VAGNATTQLFGFLNASAQIETARQLAAAKRGSVDDISTLHTGQFDATSEALRFTRLHSPICLSYHPSQPLTEEEILSMARPYTESKELFLSWYQQSEGT